MRVFAISSRNLALLDAELGGRLSAALVEVARSGFDPEIRITRSRPDPDKPSSWTLIACGDGVERQFPADHSLVAVAICARLYLIDFSAELKADLACRGQAQELIDDVDAHLPWQRCADGAGEPS